MKKFIYPILLGLLFTACQNTPKAAVDSPATEVAAPETPAASTPEAMQETIAKLTTGIKMFEGLRKQVDALPAMVKKEKSAEIEGMYATLEGMIEKQTGMINELTVFANPGSKSDNQQSDSAPGLSSAQLKDFNDAVILYTQEAQAIEVALQKMVGASKK